MLDRLRIPNHEPVFLNQGAFTSELELKKLEALRDLVADADKERLEQDIRILRAGIAGEKKVAFEIMSSHYPLILIHDLCLEHEGASAQIDFLVVTPYNSIVIECKNLVGDIEIDSSGSFVRTFVTGRRRRREGIYSPITQNKRHIELVKAVVRSGRGSFIQFVQRMTHDDYYHSIVVLANETTLLDAEQAPREIREKVIRADQLVAYIKRLDRKYARKNGVESFANMEKRAQMWLDRNSPRAVDVLGRYELAAVGGASPQGQAASSGMRANETTKDGGVPSCPVCGAPMVLRTARYGKHKGNKFWGCSTWANTRCGGIVSVE